MIVVGYTADRFGHAALELSIAEAKLAGSPEVHDVEAHLAGCGVEYESTNRSARSCSAASRRS